MNLRFARSSVARSRSPSVDHALLCTGSRRVDVAATTRSSKAATVDGETTIRKRMQYPSTIQPFLQLQRIPRLLQPILCRPLQLSNPFLPGQHLSILESQHITRKFSSDIQQRDIQAHRPVGTILRLPWP